MRKPVGIVGAGLAGLSAARRLGGEGRPVRIVEARSRLGGRADTRRERGAALPVELGAEFVHGAATPTSALAREAEVRLEPVLDRHYRCEGREFRPMGDVWARFARVLQGSGNGAASSSADEFLRRVDLDGRDAWLFRALVEGFHAAPLDDVAVDGLREQARAAVEDPVQLRPEGGYGALVDALARSLDPARTRIDVDAVVEEIHHEPRGACVLVVRSGGTVQEIDTERCIVTVPLGVLASPHGGGAIRFSPALPERGRLLSLYAMGRVVKVVLTCRRSPWMSVLPAGDFFHFDDGPFPTFWRRDHDGDSQLTAWAGGPHADRLSGFTLDDLVALAVKQLSYSLVVDPAAIVQSIVAAHHHDFDHDPFSLGAYPYAKPGGADRIAELSRPEGNALFFAGDGTDVEHFGTVAGAYASGVRAAEQILSAG